MTGKSKLSSIGEYIFLFAKHMYGSPQEIEDYVEKLEQLWAAYGSAPIRINRKIKKKCPAFNDVRNFGQLGPDLEARGLVVKVKKDWYSITPLLQKVLTGEVSMSESVQELDEDKQKLKELAEFLKTITAKKYRNDKEAEKYAKYVLLISKIRTHKLTVTWLERIQNKHPGAFPEDLGSFLRDLNRDRKILISPGSRFDYDFSSAVLKFLKKLG